MYWETRDKLGTAALAVLMVCVAAALDLCAVAQSYGEHGSVVADWPWYVIPAYVFLIIAELIGICLITVAEWDRRKGTF